MNNQSIKFLSVTIQNFRGVPDELVIPLDAPLTVIHAANGTGKSTICYALEWLLTGKVDDLPTTNDFSCQWGYGDSIVSATCLIGGELHELARQGHTLTISRNGERKRNIKEAVLLELLTPGSVSGRTPQAIRKAKSGWLRNSRWLYSNSLSLLVDNNKAEERQQIFADILGLGHLTSTLRDLRDYRKQLPSTKGIKDRVENLSIEIADIESKLVDNSPLKEKAEKHLSELFKCFPKQKITGKLGEDFRNAQYQVNVLDLKVKNKLEILEFLSENWQQYNTVTAQLVTLRRTLDELMNAKENLSKEQAKSSAELSVAEVKVAEGKRSVAWAKQYLDILEQWDKTIEDPSIGIYFPSQDATQEQLEQQFVELAWTSEKQQEWIQSLNYLNQNSNTVLELVKQKQELANNIIHPVADIANISRLAEEAKLERVKAESEFNALSGVLEKLRALGQEIVHSHDGQHCPLCNYDWKSSETLRKKVEDNLSLPPKLNDVAQKLTNARKVEQDCLKNLNLANNQKVSHEAFLARVRSVDEELLSIAQRTKYLEIMGFQDFASFSVDNLTYLQSRIRAAISLKKIFEVLSEVEGVFQVIDLKGGKSRVSIARENLNKYREYYQIQEDKFFPEKHRLTLLVNGILENLQTKSREIDGVNTNISATSKIVGRFMGKWNELNGEVPIEQHVFNSVQTSVQAERKQVDAYKAALVECEAIVNIDLDSGRLDKLRNERDKLAKKLDAGNDYITEADRTIERYSQHVSKLTNSSLAPLLKPAAELFSRMHANEVYRGLSVSDGDEAMKWTVFADGHDFALDAEERFSQGQRQDLALSLYLARARNTGGSFFLDEPIAHLDDLNRVAMLDIFRLAATSMPNMNLILTTASDGLARHMIQKFSSITDRHLLNTIYLEGNPRTGVNASIIQNTRSALSS